MLNISPEKVCFFIIKAREFDVKVEPVMPDPGGNPGDDGEMVVLSDYADDATYQELMSFLSDLNRDELVTLVALAWLGRDDFVKEEWPDIVAQADESFNERTPEYLVGMPLLSDYLEEGLSNFGESCEEYELNRL